MPVQERITRALSKHFAQEVLIIGIVAIVIAAAVFWMLINYYGVAVSLDLGAMMYIYVPVLLLLALGGVIAVYSSERHKHTRLRLLGFGMILSTLILLTYFLLTIFFILP